MLYCGAADEILSRQVYSKVHTIPAPMGYGLRTLCGMYLHADQTRGFVKKQFFIGKGSA